ncbi:phosphatidylinositol 3,4,5-trisphosphate 5-phosphatase 2B-like isoform X2 [Selaginella moellendorffii]|uniref:phosphatidylinositol 3,4,5-trisphosphate 5-phosphatase 2B-like isoform X2 n=1 Tax=Selaginella moellendorffii TaxID=88036 RepID=UPI000D1CD472|nr:phosphatidylinositol 3,4,5-trisphosphate 5-phosphatase 2B-like isoform X2 [Selaginella moellendorffii]|eukprot:XP_024522283.1 phosphatidylinositol 3,4,5-trisphosphate 5-phosphatase 2B-like isoform X2 [Selaginella moellendorffii]
MDRSSESVLQGSRATMPLDCITEDDIPQASVPVPCSPRRFSSLPKALEQVSRNLPKKGFRSFSHTGIYYPKRSLPEELDADVKCVPKFSALAFGKSKMELAASQEAQEVSTSENVLPRACRIRVNIVAVKNLKKRVRDVDVKVAGLKLKVENQSRHSKQIRVGAIEQDGSVKVNQSFTFDIKDPNNAVLLLHVVSKTRFGGEDSLGISTEVRVADLLDKKGGGQDGKTKWYDLFSKTGKRLMPGKVLMDIVAGIAEPEHDISVFLGTWNVGNARPAADLSSWLPTKSEHELLVIGAQECDYPPRPPFSDCAKDWINSVKSCIGQRYKLVCAVSRSQIRLAAFVRDDAEKAISEMDSGSEATGVGHVVANKGAVCIAFKFWDTDLCFVNSHLAAHMGYCDVRNGNYREIVENLSIGYQGMDILSKFHHVFWMGDLNYRLDFENVEERTVSPEKGVWQKVVDQINAGNYKELLDHDELTREIAASRAFHGFKEGNIGFAPTFKMIRDTLSSYNEKRLPAWCDRILCRSFDGCYMRPTSYFSAPEICTSDHKPVGATVSLTAYALPCLNFDADGRKWHILLTSLEAQGLRSSDINGFSDPYVSFGGANLVSEFHSKVKYRTLNPVWDPAKDLPKLVVTASSLHRLEHEYLMCHVLDYDFTSANDTLAFFRIRSNSAQWCRCCIQAKSGRSCSV